MRNQVFCCKAIVILLMMLSSNSYAAGDSEQDKNISERRNQETTKKGPENLVQTLPGTFHWMPEVAYRYQSLYWAAEQGKWEFANYQIESLEKLLKLVATARASRAPSIQIFSDNVFPSLYQAASTKNIAKFKAALANTAAECMACHVREGFEYITVPIVPPKPNSIVLGFPE